MIDLSEHLQTQGASGFQISTTMSAVSIKARNWLVGPRGPPDDMPVLSGGKETQENV